MSTRQANTDRWARELYARFHLCGACQGAVTLAEGARRAWGATYGLAIVADAVTDEPSGPWVAVAAEGKAETRHLRFRGGDRRARSWHAVMALEFIRRLLLGLAEGWMV